MNEASVEAILKRHGQEHLLRFWDDLSDDDQMSFTKELLSIDFERISHLSNVALQDLTHAQIKKDEFMEPLPNHIVGKIGDIVGASSKEQVEEWYNEGLKQISEGSVAVLLLAGGQGTRLGVSYPKGMYNVGLPSGKTLYQLQAERINKIQELANEKFGSEAVIKWYIMTSDATLKETKMFFKENDYFGLKSSNITFFEQNLLPCLTFEGKMMLKSRGSLAMAPDGNGGLYYALKTGNILKSFDAVGIRHVYVYCVDNILVKVADPEFIGFCVKNNLECGNKVTEKIDPHESVGICCKCEGKYQVVEYSEISPSTCERREADGSLTFNASNMCIHYFTTQFLNKVCNNHLYDLPHHISKKKIPHLSESGDLVIPMSPNGMKLEKFVFDVFPYASRFGVLEGERIHEFSPLKNGTDSAKSSPSSCRSDLLRLHHWYLKNVGATFFTEKGLNSDENTPSCEISPLLSYAGEGLAGYKDLKLRLGKTVHLEAVVQP